MIYFVFGSTYKYLNLPKHDKSIFNEFYICHRDDYFEYCSNINENNYHWRMSNPSQYPFLVKKEDKYWSRTIYISTLKNKRHNDFGPAIIEWSGAYCPRVIYKHYQNDILHSEYGPARYTKDGSIKQYFLFGKEYKEKEYESAKESIYFR